jgi:cyclic beta-1,2-glucan synthetase
MVDAIVRTIARLLVTRRHLLEWVTADRSSHVEVEARAVVRQMGPAVVAAFLITLLVAWQAPGRLIWAMPIVVLWLLSPSFAYTTGLPARRNTHGLDDEARLDLRKTARRTWRFFDDLIGPEDHWLVPDNLQEDRREAVAHRTSPTNIGLQLLSVLAAHDFGYLTTGELLTRLERTLDTLGRMERYRGHFYNWYDTKTLAPLAPRYISTVDSGNLAGYLLTLRGGLRGLARKPVVGSNFLAGVRDAIELCDEELGRAAEEGVSAATSRGIRRELAGLREQLESQPRTLSEWRALIAQLRDRLTALGVLLHDLD